MEIILFRHGIAEAKTAENNDEERKLTKKGIKEVKAAAKGLGRLMKGRKNALVYSSHLRRALQTADIIADKLSLDGVSIREYIATGNLAELAKEMQKCKSKATVIVVGHDPHFSEWCKVITKNEIFVKKASAVGIEINDRENFAGILKFYVTPEALKRLAK